MTAWLALALTFANGAWLLQRLWPRPEETERGPALSALRLALAFAIGTAFQSLAHYVSMAATRSAVLGLGAEALLCGLAAVTSLRQRTAPLAPGPAVDVKQLGVYAFVAVLAFQAILAARAFHARWAIAPYGYYDAIMTWTVRAEFLFHGGDGWPAVWSEHQENGDYPLLVSQTFARLWTWAGRQDLFAALVACGLFTFGTVGVVGAALTLLRGPLVGLAATATLFGFAFLFTWGACLYADLPLAFAFVLGVATFALAERYPADRARLALLAGLMVGVGMWTKNEGLLFALTASASFALFGLASGQAGLRDAAGYCLGILPLALVTLHFKLVHAPPSATNAEMLGTETWTRLADPERWRLFGGFLARAARELAPPTLLAFLPALAFVANGVARPRRTTWLVALVFALQCVGCVHAYVSTHHNLEYILATTVDRVIAQLVPPAILLLGLFFGDAQPGRERVANVAIWTAAGLALAAGATTTSRIERLGYPPNAGWYQRDLDASKIADLMADLPKTPTAIGYVDADPGRSFRYLAARLLLAPHVVDQTTDRAWLIAHRPPAGAGWILVRDLGTGHALYRRE